MEKIIRNTKNFIYIILGMMLLMIGVMGLVLPILPGIVLIFFGLVVLSKGSEKISNSRLNKRVRRFARKSFPRGGGILF